MQTGNLSHASQRALALTLSLTLILPGPAWALRQTGLEESEQTKRDLITALHAGDAKGAAAALAPALGGPSAELGAGLEEQTQQLRLAIEKVPSLAKVAQRLKREQLQALLDAPSLELPSVIRILRGVPLREGNAAGVVEVVQAFKRGPLLSYLESDLHPAVERWLRRLSSPPTAAVSKAEVGRHLLPLKDLVPASPVDWFEAEPASLSAVELSRVLRQLNKTALVDQGYVLDVLENSSVLYRFDPRERIILQGRKGPLVIFPDAHSVGTAKGEVSQAHGWEMYPYAFLSTSNLKRFPDALRRELAQGRQMLRAVISPSLSLLVEALEREVSGLSDEDLVRLHGGDVLLHERLHLMDDDFCVDSLGLKEPDVFNPSYLEQALALKLNPDPENPLQAFRHQDPKITYHSSRDLAANLYTWFHSPRSRLDFLLNLLQYYAIYQMDDRLAAQQHPLEMIESKVFFALVAKELFRGQQQVSSEEGIRRLLEMNDDQRKQLFVRFHQRLFQFPESLADTAAGLEELGPQQGESTLRTLVRSGVITLLPGVEKSDFVREADELLKEQGALFEKPGTISERMLENLQRRLVQISTRYFSNPGTVSVALQLHLEHDWTNLAARLGEAHDLNEVLVAEMLAAQGLSEAYRPEHYRDVGNKMLAQLRSLKELIATPPAAGPSPTQAGLEEGWALMASGRSLTDPERSLVHRAVEELFGERMAAEAAEVLRQRLDPEATLRAAGKKIWLLRGFGTRARGLMEQAGLPFEDVILTYSAPVQANGGQADLYLDALEALRLSNREETVRQQWLQQVTARVAPAAAGAAALQPLQQPAPEEAPLRAPAQQAAEELLASVSPTEPGRVVALPPAPATQAERMLPMLVQQAIETTQLVVPDDEKKYMLALVQQGKRTGGELTLAVRLAGELQVTPGQVLGAAQRNALTVPMAGDLIELSQMSQSSVGFLGKWLKQIHAVERGEGPKDEGTIEAWKQAPPEVKEETLEALAELTELWKGLQDSYDGASDISFAKVLELYNLIRSVDETKEALRGLFEYELSRRELHRRFPYRNRLMDLMERIRFARTYSSDFLEMFRPGPEDYGEEDDMGGVVESFAGLEEGAPRMLSSLGAALTPEQHRVVQTALERLKDEGIGGPDGRAYAFLAADKVRKIDADGLLEKSGMRLARAHFLNEWIRKVAGELGVQFPPDFIFSYPWQMTEADWAEHKVTGEHEEPTFFLDSSTILLLETLPEPERRVLVRQLVAQPAGEPQWDGPAARSMLDSVHQKAGRALAHAIPPDLGWNVRRKAIAGGEGAQPTGPEVLRDVWGGDHFYKGKVVGTKVADFAQRWGLPAREALAGRIRVVLEGLGTHLGPPGSYAVALGAQMDRPLIFEKGLLAIDATVLALPIKQIGALTQYGAAHFNRANSVPLEEATAREVVAYFEDALDLVQEDGRLEALSTALQGLGQQGWDTQPHLELLKAVRRSREEEDVRKAIKLTDLPRSERMNKRSRLMSAMKGRLTGRGGKLLPEKIVQAAFGQLPKWRTMRVLSAQRFLVPTVQEVAHLMALRPGLSFAQAREVLGINTGLLLAVRIHGWEDLAMRLSFWSLREALEDLRQGPRSWICCAVSGDWPRGLEDNDRQSWVFVAYRDAVRGLSVLEGAVEGEGSLRQKNAFPALQREEWIFFLSQIKGQLYLHNTETARMVARSAGRDPTVLRLPWEVFLETAREQEWRGGLQMIQARGDAAGLLDFLLQIRSAKISDSKKATQMLGDSITQKFEEFKQVLLEGLLKRWGLSLGMLLRTGFQPDPMGLYFQSYRPALQAAVERSASAALAEKGRPLEAVYLIAAQLKIPLPDDLREEARGLVEAAWPSLVAVGFYEPSEMLALERAAFRYLLSIEDAPTLELLTEELARYVATRRRFLPNTATYARTLLVAGVGEPTALASLVRFYLREVLTRETPDLADRAAEFRAILGSYTPEVRRGVFEGLYRTPDELKAILTSVRDHPLKSYLVAAAPPELVAEHLKAFDVQAAGQILQGVDPRVIRSVTSEFQQGRRGPDILAREVYNEFVQQLPATVESYQTGEELPNHYAMLGVPRSATGDVLKRSYRFLAFLYHPDRFFNEGPDAMRQADERFKLITEAWGILSDTEKRGAYNRQIPNKAHLYPSEPWYERIPPEVAKQTEEMLAGPSTPLGTGLEEREPTAQRVQQALKKLESGRAGQREFALKWLERWMRPEVHPEISSQGEALAEALILNLRFFTPKVRRKAGQLLLSAIQQRQFPPAVWDTLPSAVAALLGHPYDYVREDAQTLLFHFPHRGYGPVQKPMIAVVVPLLKHEDETRRRFAYGLYVTLLSDSTADPALHQPGLGFALQGLEDPSGKVRETAQRVVAIGLKRGWVAKEKLPVVFARSAANLQPGTEDSLRLAAARTLVALPVEALVDEPRMQEVTRWLVEATAPGGVRYDKARVGFLEALALLAGAAVQPAVHQAAIAPTLQMVASDPEPSVRQAAQAYLKGMMGGGIASQEVGTLISGALTALTDLEPRVKRAAQRTLLTIAESPAGRESLLLSMPALFDLLNHGNEGTREVVRELLVALAAWEEFRRVLEERKIQPSDLGLRTDLNWSQMGPFISVWNHLINLDEFGQLTLGARAVLRRTLSARAKVETSRLLAEAKGLTLHLWQLEALDQALGLPTAGAELHVPFETEAEHVRLAAVADRMASDIGPHQMTPSQKETATQVDLRLLPAYPAAFTRLLHLFLETPEMEPYFSWVAAHYTAGIDLGGDLAHLALALFYGEMTYPWLPIPRGGAQVGFPGAYIYRGAKLNEMTGEVEGTQSSMHLRVLVVLKAISMGRGQPMYQPQELFPQDLENYMWLAMAADSPQRSPARIAYESFLIRWRAWLEGLGGSALSHLVSAAEKAVKRTSGQGVNDLLDTASARIYEALYGISPEEVSRQQQGLQVPPAASVARAQPRREELAQILQESIREIQEVAMSDPEVRRTLLAYRRAETLEELDQAYEHAVKALVKALWAEERPEPKKEERLLELLSALDPDQAARIRQGLRSLPEPGPVRGAAGTEADRAEAEARLRSWLQEAALGRPAPVIGIGSDRARQYRGALQALAHLMPDALKQRIFLLTDTADEAAGWEQTGLFASNQRELIVEELVRRFGTWPGRHVLFHGSQPQADALQEAISLWEQQGRFWVIAREQPADLHQFLEELLANLRGMRVREWLKDDVTFQQALSDAELLVGA